MRLSLRLAVCAFALALAGAALAGPIPAATFTPFPLPGGAAARLLAPGPDGALWLVDGGPAARIGRYRSSGELTWFNLTAFGANPLILGLTTGPDGNLWFSVALRKADGTPDGSAIGRMTPQGTQTAFPVPSAAAFANQTSAGIAGGPGGTVWFTEPASGRVGRITPGGSISEFRLSSSSAGPRQITSGRDGAIWFTEASGKIGRIDPSGELREFEVPDTSAIPSRPEGIAGAPDGSLVFTDPGQNKVGRVTSVGSMSLAALPTKVAAPAGLAVGQDGLVYLAEGGVGQVGRLDAQSLAVLESAIPGGGAPASVVRSPFASADGPIRADLLLTVLDGGSWRVVRLLVAPGCPGSVPRVPTFRDAPTVLPSLRDLRLTLDSLENDVSLVVEASCLPDFSVLAARDEGPGTAGTGKAATSRDFLLPTASAPCTPLYVRGWARRSCSRSRPTDTLVLEGARGEVEVAFDPAGIAMRRPKGASVIGTTAAVRNIGTTLGTVLLQTDGDFFTASPNQLLLDPGALTYVTVAPTASALQEAGRHEGALVVSYGGRRSFRVPVTLDVYGSYSSSPPPVRVTGSPLVLRAPAGQDPPPTTVSVSAGGPGALPAWLFASRQGPGAWLRTSGLPALLGAGSFPLQLRVDRSSRSDLDGPGPWLSRLLVDAGDPATGAEVAVWDTLPPVVQTGPQLSAEEVRSLASAPGLSFVVPAAVKAGNPGYDVSYLSDGWLRNEDPLNDAQVTLAFTPDGHDGTADPAVRRTTVTIPAGATMRLYDLLGTFLDTAGAGQVRVTSDAAASLSLRTTAEAITGGDPALQFGSEIPVVASGGGVGAGDGELVIPGVSDDSSRRVNLILAETAGAPATASVRLFAPDGTEAGSLPGPVQVPAFGRVQLNQVVRTMTGGTPLTGGSLAVRVTAGDGKVAAVTTVIDNASNSFSAARGRVPAALAAKPPAALPTQLVVPSVARVRGAFDTLFTTRLSLSNGGDLPARLELTYRYVDVASGERRVSTRTTTLPARGSLDPARGEDVVGTFFGVGEQSYGWIDVSGDVGQVVAVAAVSALVDPNDPSKGEKTAQVEGLPAGSREIAAGLNLPRSFAGAEKSSRKRTNLILVETSGQPVSVRVRVLDKTGRLLGTSLYGLDPWEYRQVNDVFGYAGIGAGDGPFVDATLSVDVHSGSGRVVSFVTVNDNVSRNPEIFLLGPPGPPPAGATD